MNYLVVEMQTANGQTAALNYSYDNKLDAESKYHAVLSAAAISQVPIHAAVLLTEEGNRIAGQYYSHPQEGVNNGTD